MLDGKIGGFRTAKYPVDVFGAYAIFLKLKVAVGDQCARLPHHCRIVRYGWQAVLSRGLDDFESVVPPKAIVLQHQGLSTLPLQLCDGTAYLFRFANLHDDWDEAQRLTDVFELCSGGAII